MKTLTATLFLLAPLLGYSQTSQAAAPTGAGQKIGTDASEQPKVSVTSRGNDVRLILTNIFSQAKKSLIMQPNIQYNLYLSLSDTDFQKAVEAICEQAGLKYEVRDGIYHVYARKSVEAKALDPAPDRGEPVHATSQRVNHGVPHLASGPGRLPLAVLKRRVTTRLAKAPIGAVLEELGAQAGVKIELGDNVPAYRLDAILTGATLRYALEKVTRAARLTYSLTDHHTILVDSRS